MNRKNKLTITLAVLTALLLNIYSFIIPTKAQSQDVEFICATSYYEPLNRNVPTTFIWTPRGKIKTVVWQSKEFIGSGWNPQKRCETVSQRLQKFYEQDNLKYFTNGFLNKQRVICTAKGINEKGTKCKDEELVLTLAKTDDSLQISTHFADLFNGTQRGPIVHSTKQTWFEIDIENFIKTAPVEQE